MEKYLIINADDLGVARPTNLAIKQALRHGLVTSASLLTNMPEFEHALEQVVCPNPQLGLGLHFCLTSGKPVLPAAAVPLLVDPRGEFCHGFAGLYRLTSGPRRAEAISQIAAELAAQAERVDRRGLRIDHLDSHQHVHMIPAIFSLAAAWAVRRGAALRIPRERFRRAHLRPSRWIGSLANGGLVKKAILAQLARRARLPIPGLIHADHYFGVLETGQLTSQTVREIVASLRPGVSELNCHPGLADVSASSLVCSLADRRFLASPRRQVELEALLDDSLRARLAAGGVQLARFADVMSRAA